MLKIAKLGSWMKSTTWPMAKDGSRNSRSVRLPRAPPSSSPSASAHQSEPSLRSWSRMATDDRRHDDGEHPGDVLADGERGAGVPDVVPVQQRGQHRDPLALGHGAGDPELGELVEDVGEDGKAGEQGEQQARRAGRAGGGMMRLLALVLVRQSARLRQSW